MAAEINDNMWLERALPIIRRYRPPLLNSPGSDLVFAIYHDQLVLANMGFNDEISDDAYLSGGHHSLVTSVLKRKYGREQRPLGEKRYEEFLSRGDTDVEEIHVDAIVKSATLYFVRENGHCHN